MQSADLIRLIGDRRPAGETFAVLSRSAAEPDVVAMPDGQWLSDVALAADLGGLGYLGLIVVTDQIEHMTPDEARHLLARLRDRHSGLVIVHDPTPVFAVSDYLALGFEIDEQKDCYVFDAAAESRQRDWNNARDWANPENFDKFRW